MFTALWFVIGSSNKRITYLLTYLLKWNKQMKMYCRKKKRPSQTVGGARACDLGEPEKFLHQKKHCSNIPMDSRLLLRASCLPYADGEQPSIPVINTIKKKDIKMMIYKI